MARYRFRGEPRLRMESETLELAGASARAAHDRAARVRRHRMGVRTQSRHRARFARVLRAPRRATEGAFRIGSRALRAVGGRALARRESAARRAHALREA